MIQVTFLNVGQGDTTILEWKNEGVKKIGIIDCKLERGANVVIEYLIDNGYTSISFIILSHPHKDHFSGMTSLIQHCIDNGIGIGHFLHTSNNMPVFWKHAVKGVTAKNEIARLFELIREAKNSLGMKFSPIQGQTAFEPIINLTDLLKIEVLNPISEHLDKYAANQVTEPIEEEDGNLPSANWLSTVLKIYCKNADWYILLTSDVQKDALFFNGTRREEYKGRVVLAQCPHHGALGNFKKSFWKKLNPDNRKIPIVISVGENGYDHPSDTVIRELQSLNYDIHSTNEVGGLLVLHADPEELKKAKGLISFSERAYVKSNKFNGNQVFNIDHMGNVS